MTDRYILEMQTELEDELMSDIQATPESDEKTLSAETAHGVMRADLDRCHVQAAHDGCEKMPVLRTAQRR